MAFYINRFSMIERQIYKIDIITPMFLSGAEQQGNAEFRTATVKGMLRFWWRALHPELVNNGNFKNLKEKESEIFGDAGEKFGKSKVKISITSANLKTKKYSPLPHKEKNNFTYECLDVGQGLYLTLYAPEEIHNLFRFMSIAGGLGKRSRRGFGSFSINNDDKLKKIDLDILLNLIKSVNSNNLFKIDNIEPNKIICDKKDKYIADNLISEYPFLIEIQIGKKIKQYGDLLKDIGKASHEHNSDYTGFARGRCRLASPVYVSVIKIEDNFMPIISSLNTAFDNKGNNKSANNLPDRSLEFKNKILSYGD
ncbi:MAG: type III-B CRISPR module RAMP protein Cmr1 [Candidatus Acididesulfobacter diazotrophicus]|uniref:Type III-B CRISPR module RAMP protein Cmr1 n=1 Tax=Candidatus Acididesulfobacter diazotrophicus TaxID=2597226 RepID=A0A519BQB0_9DELT|nr:MAG: type III-B CRISPR module RAMP protein Cmr1 [Candidatus Acididesulfobacter diazotrophicus]